MVAITCRQYPTPGRPRGLLTSLPAGRRPPSAAARREWTARVVAALVALVLLLGAGSLAGAEQDAAGRPGAQVDLRARPVSATVHVVQPGDTLWSLARRVQPEGDVRPLVARLRAQHGGGPLLPGDRLRLAV